MPVDMISQGKALAKSSAMIFVIFDFILAMDQKNLIELYRACPAEFQGKIERFLKYSRPASGLDVPDPYYGGDTGFEHVIDLIEGASEALVQNLKADG